MKKVTIALLILLAGCSPPAERPELREGRSIYGAICAACHGPRGQGGVGPSLAGVAATWPSCADQIEWIALGSDGWRSLYGDTYGSAEKPVEGGMPAHAARLTEGEMALVAAFERIEYGGEDADDALADCGVAGPTE